MSIELNSFTNLIEENKLRFYKTAKAILKNDDDVYDALQEALMSIYQNFNQLKNLKFFSTWATRIVINKCYDLLRKNKNNVVPFDENIENDINSSKNDVYKVDQYGIKKAVEGLNEELKLITILYVFLIHYVFVKFVLINNCSRHINSMLIWSVNHVTQ